MKIYFEGYPDAEITSRDELYHVSIQLRIRRCGKIAGGIRCGCCEARPPLGSYSAGRGLTLRTAHTTDHDRTKCILILSQVSLDDVRPTDGIFADRDSDDAILGLPNSDGPPVVTYRGYVGRMVSGALVESWVSHLGSRRLDPNPSARATIGAIDFQLRTMRFASGEPGPTVAQRHGLRLAHGLAQELGATPREMGEPGVLPLLVLAAELAESELRLTREMFGIETWRLKRAFAEAKHWNAYTRGPYYFFAAVDEEGLVRRLALLPVYFDGLSLVFVDSGKERLYARQLLLARRAFFKATNCREISQLARRQPELSWLADIDWLGCTPDFVGLSASDRFIYELNGGIREGDYLLDLQDKLARYTAEAPGVTVLEIHGEHFDSNAKYEIETGPAAILIDWRFPPLPSVLLRLFNIPSDAASLHPAKSL